MENLHSNINIRALREQFKYKKYRVGRIKYPYSFFIKKLLEFRNIYKKKQLAFIIKKNKAKIPSQDYFIMSNHVIIHTRLHNKKSLKQIFLGGRL